MEIGHIERKCVTNEYFIIGFGANQGLSDDGMTIYVDQWEEMCYAKKAAEPSAENEVRQLYGRIAHHIFCLCLSKSS